MGNNNDRYLSSIREKAGKSNVRRTSLRENRCREIQKDYRGLSDVAENPRPTANLLARKAYHIFGNKYLLSKPPSLPRNWYRTTTRKIYFNNSDRINISVYFYNCLYTLSQLFVADWLIIFYFIFLFKKNYKEILLFFIVLSKKNSSLNINDIWFQIKSLPRASVDVLINHIKSQIASYKSRFNIKYVNIFAHFVFDTIDNNDG